MMTTKRAGKNPAAPPLWALVLVPALLLLMTGCSPQEDNEAELRFLVATEPPGPGGLPPGQERVDELRRDIERHEGQIRDVSRSLNQVASLQRLLANELMQQGLYGPALDALGRALELQGESPALFYLAAVASARQAPGLAVRGAMEEGYERAEFLYRQAIRLDPNHREALYGLAVLLTFPLDRPGDALEPLRHLVAIETGDLAPRFLLANVLVRLGQTREAEQIYDEIARTATMADQRRRAEANRDALRRELP